MSVSIKLNGDAAGIAGIDAKKSYEVLGFSGGCVIILDDDNAFREVPHADIVKGWSIAKDTESKPVERQSLPPQTATAVEVLKLSQTEKATEITSQPAPQESKQGTEQTDADPQNPNTPST